MKKVEDLEKEYEKYELKSDYITNLLEFLALLEIEIDNMMENQKFYNKEIFLNNLTRIYGKIKSKLLFIDIEEFEDILAQDNEILENAIIQDDNYIVFFEQLSQIATENNFKELTKLVDFMCEYYNKQSSYFEARRDAIEYKMKGFSYLNPNMEDNSEVVKEFINKKINNYPKEKPVEKAKKI